MTNKRKANPVRAQKERYLDLDAYYSDNPEAASLAEELWHHQIHVGQVFRDFILNDPVYAALERRMRETFVDASGAMIQCNPSDAKGIMDAQVNARAAALLMNICDEIINEMNTAKDNLQISADLEDQ